MWRWIVRVYVSLVVFWFLMFMSSLALIEVTRLMSRMGLPFLTQLVHSHVLFTMFLLGVLAGQVVLGSNLTGRGWFRSKSGQTYEGFKLEKLKPWTWLLVSPIFLLGVVSWCLEQSESEVLSSLSFAGFYQGFLMPNCSNIPLRAYQFNIACTMQLLFVGFLMASIGYSLAPWVRRRGSRWVRSMRSANELTIPAEDGQQSLTKEKTE